VDRREKSGVKPEQLRCCNWIQFPTSQSFGYGSQTCSLCAQAEFHSAESNRKSGHNVRLAHRQNARVPTSGEGGKKVSPKNLRAASQEPEYSNRSASFASVTLNPDFTSGLPVRCKPIPESASPARPRKNFFAKRRMRVERTALPRVLLSKQEDLKCRKNIRYFFWSRFSPRRFATARSHRRHLRRNQSRSSSLELGRTFPSINRPPALVS